MKSNRSFSRNRILSCLRIATAGTLISAAAAMAFVAGKTSTGSKEQTSSFKSHLLAMGDRGETLLGKNSGSGEASSIDGPAQEAYDNRAYPSKSIGSAQQHGALTAANAILTAANAFAKLPAANWQELGPSGVPASGLVVNESTAGTSPTIFSGRTTAIAVAPNCSPSSCTVFIGAAGGGVWRTGNALASSPSWSPANNGIESNAIGSIVFDPNDASGETLYAGTGEPNGSGDSEAGVGLYKSTDGGNNWSLVAGSTASTAPCASGVGTCPVATGRSIGSIAIDPADPSHIFIGTDVARHGSSSVNGGRFTPPGAAKVGLYESTDGGATFTDELILAQDIVDPGSATGGDFFRGGISHIELYRTSGETQVYASAFDYGIGRRSMTQDGDAAFHRIFQSADSSSSASRTEFSLAPNGSHLRIYVGDAPPPASFWRVDDANVAAATLFTGGTNGGWTKLSSSTPGTSGFSSYDYCGGQCSYDMPVYSPLGSPNIVYIGGAMQYGEIFTPNRPSNGRAVQRSEDAGVDFTDMTIDTHEVSLHPDQHAIAATPFNPDIVFIANDGGLWRLNGSFRNASSQCDTRGLTGTDLTDCHMWLSKIPRSISTLNNGLGTLQFQSLSLNPANPLHDLLGGTQDNGTQAFSSGKWFVSVFGDGGQSGISAFHANIRFHNYFSASPDVNFHGDSETGWDWIADPLYLVEPQSFYIPMIDDPKVDGTMFAGLNFVWRTTDNGGDQATLDAHCNELTGDFTITCGDWIRIGPGSDPLDPTKALGDGTFWGADKLTSGYVVATERAPSDNDTLWVGTRRGRLFISKNASAAQTSVAFTRIDDSTTPSRFVSGIAIDPTDPNRAYVSCSGYNAYATAAGTATGHVFKVVYNPGLGTATWTNIDHNIGDQPITGIALDSNTGDLFVSTDFGVDTLKSGGSTWTPAAGNLPPVAVYGLTIDVNARVLYAATHGRGAWRLQLP